MVHDAADRECRQPAVAERAQLPCQPFCSLRFSIRTAPNAVNYGAIGTMIGHEISHTFRYRGQRV